MTPPPTLRPYQRDTHAAIGDALAKGVNRILIKSPTGTGKTVMFAALLESLAGWLKPFPKGRRGMLVIAHREELLDQAARKILKANPQLLVCVEQAERYALPEADVICASIQTLMARGGARLRRLLSRTRFRIVVIDEAHHAAAPSYRTALVHLGFLPPADASTEENVEAVSFEDVSQMSAALADWDKRAPKDQVLVGVTATPNRSDAIGLGCVFQSLAYAYNLKDAIEDGWLVPITPWAIDTQDNLDDVRITAGEFNQKDLAVKVNNPRRNALAVAGWTDYAYGRSTIAFTVDVAHAHDLAAAFTSTGVVAAALSGETPKEERRALLRRFEAGEITVLTNCMVLTEGTDLPRASCILHCKPTKSATLYEQMTGRGLRIHPEDPAGPARAGLEPQSFRKADCVLIDVVDVTRRHSLQTAPVLYGLPPTLKMTGLPLARVEAELAELVEKYSTVDFDRLAGQGEQLTLEQLAAKAELVDLWHVPDLGAFGVGRQLRWMMLPGGGYHVDYPWLEGKENITVRRDLLDHWEVVVGSTLAAAPQPRTWDYRTIAAGVLTAEGAADIAEAFVRHDRPSILHMKAVDAAWRTRPATPKQIARLLAWRIPHDVSSLTAGEASDFIDLFITRRRHR